MLNVVILIGRLVRDPQIFSKEDVLDVVNFDIAVDNIGQDAGASFFTCKAFGKVAQNVNKFCFKGSKVAVNGRIQQRTYLAKDGAKKSIYEIICESVEFLDQKSTEENSEETSTPAPEQPKFDPMTGKPLNPSKK